MADVDKPLPPNFYDTWDRRHSTADTKYITKGLRNAPGENNCFLNSAVQVFWHLDVFRRSYRKLVGHVCMGNSCIFCSLKVIFTQFQYSDKSSLPPDSLRKAMADTFKDQHRFQLGHMDDAAECFENILRRIHYHVAHNVNEDKCNAPHCLSHQKFAMSVYDQMVCPCGAKTEPLTFHEMVHYVSANALVSQAKLMWDTGDILHPDRFGLLLRNAAAVGDIRNCPGGCGKYVQIRRTLLNCPDVVSVGLIWPNEKPDQQFIQQVMRSLGNTIMLQDVFHSVICEDVSKLPKMHLVGLVCYYGKHYSTFLFHSKLQVWIYFDDATVKEVGPNWDAVVEKCCKSRYQPLLLLYTNPMATPVNVQTAPQKTTMAPGYKPFPQGLRGTLKCDDHNSSFSSQKAESCSSKPRAVNRRSVTPVPGGRPSEPVVVPATRRAVTPGPEQGLGGGKGDDYIDGMTLYSKSVPSHQRHQSFLAAMSVSGDQPRPAQGHAHENLLGQYVYENGAVKPTYNYGHSYSDDYGNYTLSNNVQYHRPVGADISASNIPWTSGEAYRRDSYSKKVGNFRADIVCNPSEGHPSNAAPLAPPSGEQVTNLPGHIRTRSHSFRDSGNDFDQMDPNVYLDETLRHGPVESGLATLTRKQKDKNRKSPSCTPPEMCADHQKHVPVNSCAGAVASNPHYPQSRTNSDYMDQKYFLQKQQSSVNPAYNDNVYSQHSRQTSASSQSSQSTLTQSKQDYCDSMARLDSDPPSLHSNNPNIISKNSADYISRTMVDTILNQQGYKRPVPSVTSSSSFRSTTSSSSSVESDLFANKVIKKSVSVPGIKGSKHKLTVDIPYDSVSLESQKDSGYASSDRNSASSNGSTTMDPYSQYFMSRSMIPPKSIKDSSIIKNFVNLNLSDQDSASVSSTSTVNRGSGASQCSTHSCDPATQGQQGVTSEPDLINFKSGVQLHNIMPGYEEASADCSDRFMNLCRQAEELMDQCMLGETDGDLEKALRHCNSAIVYLGQAMKSINLSHQSFIFAQTKHNSCMMKARSLQMRLGDSSLSSSQNRRGGSVTSSDSDSGYDLIHLDKQGKTPRDVLKDKLASLYQNGQTATAVKAPVRTPLTRSISATNEQVTLGDKCVPQNSESDMKNYATMPRNMHIPPPPETGVDVYQSYLKHQHAQQQRLTVAPKLAITGTITAQTPDDAGRMSKSDIRQLLQSNIMQRMETSSASTPSALTMNTQRPYSLQNKSSLSASQNYVAIQPNVKATRVQSNNKLIKPQLPGKPSVRALKAKKNNSAAAHNNMSCSLSTFKQRPLERSNSQPDCHGMFQHNPTQSEMPTMPSLSRKCTLRSTPSSSQPDLRKQMSECRSAPSSPHRSRENLHDPDTDTASRISVRDLASRFEKSQKKKAAAIVDPEPEVISPLRQQRQRSISESGLFVPSKPALKKKKKMKASAGHKMRKSVTFADSLSLTNAISAAQNMALPPGMPPPPYEVAAGLVNEDEYWDSKKSLCDAAVIDKKLRLGLSSTPYLINDCLDRDKFVSNADDSPLGSDISPVELSDSMCELCLKKATLEDGTYCVNCQYYLNRFHR